MNFIAPSFLCDPNLLCCPLIVECSSQESDLFACLWCNIHGGIVLVGLFQCKDSCSKEGQEETHLVCQRVKFGVHLCHLELVAFILLLKTFFVSYSYIVVCSRHFIR